MTQLSDREEQILNQHPSRDVSVERLVWTPELVERFWSGVAQTRLTEYDFALQGGKSVIIAVEHHLPKDGRILDFGAGNGELIELLLERGYHAGACEPSRGRTGYLLDRLASRSGFLGVIGPESKERFDVVLMTDVIEHILEEELDRTLRRVHDFLTDGGTLIVTTPNNEDLELSMVYCPTSNLLFHRWQHVRSFTAESLSLLLSRYGIGPLVVHHADFQAELHVPYDRYWGGEKFVQERPYYLRAIREDIPVHMGSESHLLYIGRRTDSISR